MKINKKALLSYIFIFLSLFVLDALLITALPGISIIEPIMNNTILSIALFAILFLIIPFFGSYLITYFFFKSKEHKDARILPIWVVMVTGVLLTILCVSFLMFLAQPRFAPYTLESVEDDVFDITLSPSPTPAPVGGSQNVPPQPFVPSSTGAAVPPTIAATAPAAPTSTQIPAQPTRTPNPPQMSISYPAENQSIELNSSQTLCVVDVPAGGDGSGIQRKHSINDSAWTEYASTFTLCFSPNDGVNKVQMQFRNQYGEESPQYTRQFNFKRI